MASKSFSVSDSNNRYTLSLTLTEGTQSVANNQTPLSYKLVLKANTSYNFELYKIGRTVTLNGTTVYNVARSSSASLSIADYGSLTLAEGSTTITHNNDGTKSISVAYSMDMATASYTPGAMSGSGTMALTTIPRATQPTLSPTSVTMGNTMTINLPRAASSFSHNVFYTFGNEKDVAIKYGATTSASWNVPLSLANQIPNASSGTGTITVITFNNGSAIGTKTASFTAVVPENESTKPGCSVAISPSGNESWVTSGTYVQGKTKVSASFTGLSAKYKSSIKTYALSVGGVVKKSSTTPVVSDVLKTSGNVSYSGTVYDSRGFVSDASLTQGSIYVISYSKPSIIKHPTYNSIVCARCDANSNISDSGTNLLVRMRLKWSSLSKGENTATIRYNIVSMDGSVNISNTITATASGGGSANNYYSWYDLNQRVSNVTLEVQKAYTATITITDKYGEYDSLTFSIPTEDVALHLGEGGNKAAFGKYAEHDKTVEVADDWSLMVSGDATGRVLGLGALPKIPTNSDLNDKKYRKIGVYAIEWESTAQTIANCPSTVAGTLRVFSGNGTGRDIEDDNVSTAIYLIQEYIPYSSRMTYRRWVYKSSDTTDWSYSEWHTYYSSYLIKDYVKERSTSAIAASSPRAATTWYITKWNSGFVELHARATFSNVAVTEAWGNNFCCYLQGSSLTYPVTFKAIPMCQVTVETTVGGDLWIAGCDKVAPTTTKTAMYEVVRPTSITTQTIVLNYYVRGFI